MNNTTTKNLVTVTAIFIAAALVVGAVTLATTTTQSAFAYKKDDNKKDGGNNNGNTVTIQKNKQHGTQSGFDNTQEQESQNVICTHPGNNATCVQEGAVAAQAPVNKTQPVKLTCEQCFRTILTPEQLAAFTGSANISTFCAVLESGALIEGQFRFILSSLGVTSVTTQNELIACMLQAGIVFAT